VQFLKTTKKISIMGFNRNEMSTPDMFLHVYSGISKEELDRKVNELLTLWGYKMAGGQNGQLIYEKGNRVMRLLFGPFVKYFKISVQTIVTGPDELKCEIRTQSSGMSGGLIGMNQVKAEIQNLFNAFRDI
jgi:hypothetical protein